MGCVPSALRGEIVAIELLRHNDFKTQAPAYLAKPLRRHTKMPQMFNESWERGKPKFEPLLQEALDIRNAQRKNILGSSTKLEASLKEAGWLGRANTTMAEFGLEVIVDAKDGGEGHCLIAILDPRAPEEKVITHRGTGCFGL